MILSTGGDIAEVDRAAAIQRFGERFLHSVVTPREIDSCRSKKNVAERTYERAPHQVSEFRR